MKELEEVKKNIPETLMPAAISSLEGYQSVVIDLESVKKALRALDATPSLAAKKMKAFDRADIETIVKQTMLSHRGLSGKPKPKGTDQDKTRTPGDGRRRRGRLTKEQIQERKKNSRCNACGNIGHWAGDDECERKNQPPLERRKGARPPTEDREQAGSFFQ